MGDRFSAARRVASDPERLKFITEHFSALQGLNFVAVGTVFFLLSVRNIWDVPWWADLVAFGFLIFSIRRLPKYYERRFGRVEPKGPTNLQALLFIGFIFAALIWGRYFELILSTFENWIHQRIPDGVMPLGLWVLGLSTSLGKRLYFDPQGPYFFFFGVVVASIVAFCPLWYPSANQVMLWRILDAGGLGLSMIAWGLHNHFLLVRLFPNQCRDEDDEY